MGSKFDTPPYPPSGGIIGIGGGDDLITLQVAADGEISNTIADLGAAFVVEGCQVITVWLDIEFGTGPLTAYELHVFHRRKGSTLNYTMANTIFDISDADIDLEIPAGTVGRRYSWLAEGPVGVVIPTFGAHSMLLRQLSVGTITGSELDAHVTRHWGFQTSTSDSPPTKA